METTHTTKVKKTAKAPVPAVAQGTEIATKTAVPMDAASWGVPEITSRDIVIPKIMVMQAMSKAVTDGTAKFGEFRESLNQKIIGDTKNPVEFIPFLMEKVYVVMQQKKGESSYKFSKVIPITSENEGHEWESHTVDGTPERWYRALNFYVLFPSEIEKGTAVPLMLSFRSSSARAGQALATQMYMVNTKAGKTPASQVMELYGTKTQNDKGTFIVMDVKSKRESTGKEVVEAYNWVKLIRGGQVKVDHSDLEQEASASAAPFVESTEY